MAVPSIMWEINAKNINILYLYWKNGGGMMSVATMISDKLHNRESNEDNAESKIQMISNYKQGSKK